MKEAVLCHASFPKNRFCLFVVVVVVVVVARSCFCFTGVFLFPSNDAVVYCGRRRRGGVLVDVFIVVFRELVGILQKD